MGKIKDSVKFCLQKMLRGWIRKQDFSLSEHVKLYYWKLAADRENLGDYLSKVVVSNYVPKEKSDRKSKKTLYGIGSILGFRCQNAVVWGSGVLEDSVKIRKNVTHSKLDIRAIRGPKTRELLLSCGKNCPEVYGDPAILMPLLYTPKKAKERNKIGLVLNYEHKDFVIPEREDIIQIEIKTDDYKKFIDELSETSLVISSSLHGIILAEAYGIPAVLLLKEEAMVFKFEDYYYSTGRKDVLIARSIEEALEMEPMPLPDLTKMQKQLIDAFPRDLF